MAGTSPPSTGSLEVTSCPKGASVFVNEGYRGVTPVMISGLSPGTYNVRVSLTGFTDDKESVPIVAGDTSYIGVNWDIFKYSCSEIGSLSVSSCPDGALVYIAESNKPEVYAGTTPLLLTNLIASYRFVRISQEGKPDEKYSVMIYDGYTTAIGESCPLQMAHPPPPSWSPEWFTQYLRPISSLTGLGVTPMPTPAPRFEGAEEMEVTGVNAGSDPGLGYPGSLQYVDPNPGVRQAVIPDSGSGDTGDISRMPCGKGQVRCDKICVDYLTNPNHCGSCNIICGPGMSCKNGNCTGQTSSTRPGNWVETFLSIPNTLISVVMPQAAVNSGKGGSMEVYNPGSSDARSSGAGKDSMQVVVLPGSSTDAAIPRSGSAEPEIVVRDSGTGRNQVHLIDTPAETPTPTIPPEIVMSIPTTSIAGRSETVSPISLPCPAGQYRCSGMCTDLMNDVSNCGSCNSTCAYGTTCVSGGCSPQCSAGLVSCNGICTDLNSDVTNCGSCGHACLSGAPCTSGQCVAQMVTTQQTRIGDIGKPRL